VGARLGEQPLEPRLLRPDPGDQTPGTTLKFVRRPKPEVAHSWSPTPRQPVSCVHVDWPMRRRRPSPPSGEAAVHCRGQTYEHPTPPNKGARMSANPQSSAFNPNLGRVKIGGLLVAIGGLVGAAGVAMAGVECALASRRWVAEQNQTATAIALQRVRKALEASQAATHAAATVWQKTDEGVR